MKNDQRQNPRRPIDILLNKYIDGQPHVCRGVNISRGGMLVHRVLEPDVPHLSVTVELELPGSPEAVSYTHLDVYKRQKEAGAAAQERR